MNDEREKSIRKSLTDLMAKHGISEAELARKTDVPAATINRIMIGATPDPRLSTIRPLARYFNVYIDQLIGDEPLTNFRLTEEFSLVPVIPWEQIPNLEQLIPTLNFENWHEWEPVSKPTGKNTFALCIDRQTLGMPFIYKSILIIDPCKQAIDGDYVVIQHVQNNSVMLKRLVVDGNDRWLNAPNEHIQPILMTNEFKISGVVVRIYLPFDNK